MIIKALPQSYGYNCDKNPRNKILLQKMTELQESNLDEISWTTWYSLPDAKPRKLFNIDNYPLDKISPFEPQNLEWLNDKFPTLQLRLRGEIIGSVGCNNYINYLVIKYILSIEK